MSKLVRAVDVVNSIFGTGLFSLQGGRAVYDEVWMADGGDALYLRRLEPLGGQADGFRLVRRWIPWETVLIQHYDPEAERPPVYQD